MAPMAVNGIVVGGGVLMAGQWSKRERKGREREREREKGKRNEGRGFTLNIHIRDVLAENLSVIK